MLNRLDDPPSGLAHIIDDRLDKRVGVTRQGKLGQLVMICCKVTPDCHMGIERTKALILLVKLSPYHEQALIAGRGRQCLMQSGVSGEEFKRQLAVFSEARRGRPPIELGSNTQNGRAACRARGCPYGEI